MPSMELLSQTDLPSIAVKPQRPLAVGGMVLAVAALVFAIGTPTFLETHMSRKDAPAAFMQGAHKIKDHLAHGEMAVEPHPGISWKIALECGAALAGFLGAALGTASWARRESSRWSGIAIGAGLSAIAWNYFFFAGLAAVSLFLMAWIISHFHR
jgi:hypothetical protein